MRYKCVCSYDGSAFHGFQIQKDLRSVQQEIEDVLLIINKKKTTIYPSGRTDALVHAIGQVFHFDSDFEMLPKNMKNAINSRLPRDVYIRDVEIVSDEFHARFSALSKEYHYLIDLGEFDPIKAKYRYYFKRKLNLEKFKEAMNIFIGVHDFRSFTKNQALENTVREIYSIDFEEIGTLIKVKIIGNGFMRNMVRILVAMALEVGIGKVSIESLKSILDAKNRKLSPKTAAPEGLYLFKVNY